MLQSLLPYLGTPSFHLLALILASTTALQSLLALWAATSPRHWFWRALVIWCAVMALIPIRVYEPALVFAIRSPLIVLIVQAVNWLTRWRRHRLLAEPASRSTLQFGLSDLLLLMLFIGLSLAGLLHLFRSLPLRELPPRDWRDIILPAVAIAVLSYLYLSTYRGPRRPWAAAALVIATLLSSSLLSSYISWLDEFELLGLGMYMMLSNREFSLPRAAVIIFLFTEFAAILLLGIRYCLACPIPTAAIKFRRHFRMIGLAKISVIAVSLYVPMLWLTSFPPALPSDGSNYDRLLEIAERVSSPDAYAELPSLRAEAVSLLARTQTLPFDLSSPPVLQLVERTSIDHIQAV